MLKHYYIIDIFMYILYVYFQKCMDMCMSLQTHLKLFPSVAYKIPCCLFIEKQNLSKKKKNPNSQVLPP